MSELPDEAVEAMATRLGVLFPAWHPSNSRLTTIELLSTLPDGIYVVKDGQVSYQKERKEFNPLGGASRGVGRCICPAGPGTNPACQVHP